MIDIFLSVVPRHRFKGRWLGLHRQKMIKEGAFPQALQYHLQSGWSLGMAGAGVVFQIIGVSDQTGFKHVRPPQGIFP
jgi:hypothetical protein